MISREVGGGRMAKDRRGSRRRVLVCEQQEHFEDVKFPSSWEEYLLASLL